SSDSRRSPNMPQLARLWKGAGVLTLGGLLLSGAPAWGSEPAPSSARPGTGPDRPAVRPRTASDGTLRLVAMQVPAPADDTALPPEGDPDAVPAEEVPAAPAP